jgi:protein-L-isoaspartate(D-aspartate) O-methyltransferase
MIDMRELPVVHSQTPAGFGVLGGMLLITRPDQGSAWPAKFVSRAAFVGCVGLQDEEAAQRLSEAFSKDWDRVRSLRLDTSPDKTSWFAGDGWWLSRSELEVEKTEAP